MSRARQIADLISDLDNVATSGQYSDLAGNPTQVSSFTNDAGYITNASIPTAVSDLTNDSNFSTVAYVDGQVSSLIDSAPGTLDTLNELAAALGDDANFASTMTSSLANKANTADLDAVATSGSYADLSNKPFRNTSETTASAGNTASTVSASSNPDDVECFLNGIRLASSDYTTAFSSGTVTVTLDEACVANDIVELVAWKLS